MMTQSPGALPWLQPVAAVATAAADFPRQVPQRQQRQWSLPRAPWPLPMRPPPPLLPPYGAVTTPSKATGALQVAGPRRGAEALQRRLHRVSLSTGTDAL